MIKVTKTQKTLLEYIKRKPLLFNNRLMQPIHPLCDDVQYRTYIFLSQNGLISCTETSDVFNTYKITTKGLALLK